MLYIDKVEVIFLAAMIFMYCNIKVSGQVLRSVIIYNRVRKVSYDVVDRMKTSHYCLCGFYLLTTALMLFSMPSVHNAVGWLCN